MQVGVYSQENKKVGEVALADEIFAEKWNPTLVRFVYLAQQANRRQPWAHAKDRSEVRGGGKKPWRQKGTGRARHGSIRSPLWRGGGATFGPRNEKDYSQKVNRKMKEKALFSLLAHKASTEFLRVIDQLSLTESKTKLAAGILKNFFGAKKEKVLFVISAANKTFIRAARNLPGVEIVRTNSLDLGSCLDHRWVFFEQSALAELKKKK